MLAKVHQINLSKDVSDVYESFVRNHYRNSKKTGEEYSRRVEEFSTLVFNKPIRFVTPEELTSLKSVDIENLFVQTLEENGNSKSTIKTKLNSIRSFAKELAKNDISINPSIFDFKIKSTTNHHEALSKEELLKMYDFMKNQSSMGLEKYLVAKTLFITGNRKTATFDMEWKNIQRKRDVSGSEAWVITVEDKGGKIVEKPISDEFYDELLQIRGDGKKVFSLHPKTFWRSVKKFGEEIGKNITIHSLKATALTIGYQVTKDINLCKQLGSHSSIATTEIYVKPESDYLNQLSFINSSTEDDSILELMTHQELIDFINENGDIKTSILNRLRTKNKNKSRIQN